MPNNINSCKKSECHNNFSLVPVNTTSEGNDDIKPKKLASVKNVNFKVVESPYHEVKGQGTIETHDDNVQTVDEKLAMY